MTRGRRKAQGLAFAPLVAGMVFSMAGAAGAAEVQDELSAVKRELAAVKAELSALRRELGQLRTLLARGERREKRPARAKVSIKDRPVLGRADAPVTIVEFSDYQCPYCRRFTRSVLPSIKKDYVETGKVRYVFKDFPIERIHPRALGAAVAAHCAGEQGKYWEMHDLLFDNQKKLSPDAINGHAGTLGLEAAAFEACLASGRYKEGIAADQREGRDAGVRGTPTFIVGRTVPGESVEGAFVRGAQPYRIFKAVIEKTLGESAETKR